MKNNNNNNKQLKSQLFQNIWLLQYKALQKEKNVQNSCLTPKKTKQTKQK